MTQPAYGAQVPFIKWMDRLGAVQALVAAMAPRVTPWLFGEAGRQFFLADCALGDGGDPLLVHCSAQTSAQWVEAVLYVGFKSSGRQGASSSGEWRSERWRRPFAGAAFTWYPKPLSMQSSNLNSMEEAGIQFFLVDCTL